MKTYLIELIDRNVQARGELNLLAEEFLLPNLFRFSTGLDPEQEMKRLRPQEELMTSSQYLVG